MRFVRREQSQRCKLYATNLLMKLFGCTIKENLFVFHCLVLLCNIARFLRVCLHAQLTKKKRNQTEHCSAVEARDIIRKLWFKRNIVHIVNITYENWNAILNWLTNGWYMLVYIEVCSVSDITTQFLEKLYYSAWSTRSQESWSKREDTIKNKTTSVLVCIFSLCESPLFCFAFLEPCYSS